MYIKYMWHRTVIMFIPGSHLHISVHAYKYPNLKKKSKIWNTSGILDMEYLTIYKYNI